MKSRSHRTVPSLPRKVASKPLLHPPLSQVAFEVNFPNLFAVETGIAEYQRRVQALFPNSGGEYVVRLPPSAFGKSPKQESAELKPMRSFVFQNPAASRTIRVSVVNFTLLVTDYLHFEDYKDALCTALEPAIEIFQLHNVDRIGLRYINEIHIPSEQAELGYNKYVRSPIDTSTFSAHHPTNFLTEVSADLDNTKKLTIRSGLLPAQAGEPMRTYLFDLDCYSIGNVPLSGEGLTNLLDQFHEAIEAEFLRTVTEQYWKYMTEGELR